MKRSLRSRLLPAFLSVALSVALMEIGVRASGLARHLYTEPIFQPLTGQPSTGTAYWRYRPGFEGRALGPTKIRIGPRGTRLHDRPAGAPEPTSRVAVFGDSVTFGLAVDENHTYPALLEQGLVREGIAAEVLNFGVQGHTLEMIVEHLEDRWAETRPGCVVFAFISDDLDPARADAHVDRFGYLTKNVFGPPSPAMDVFRGAMRRSHLALLLKNAWIRARQREPDEDQAAGGDGSLADEEAKTRFRKQIARFQSLVGETPKIVFCADVVASARTRQWSEILSAEFPDLRYIDAAPAFADKTWSEVSVPRDGHPNEFAHATYARLLLPAVAESLR